MTLGTSFGAIGKDKLRGRRCEVGPLPHEIHLALNLALDAPSFHRQSLFPIAMLSPRGLDLTVHQRLLSSPDRTLITGSREMITDSYRRVLATLPDSVSESAEQVALHVWPKLRRPKPSKYRYPTLRIGHHRWPKTESEALARVNLVPGLDQEHSLLSFRDACLNVHLPMDYFLPGDNHELRELIAAQAILYAVASDAVEAEALVQQHTLDALVRNALFDFPIKEQIVERGDAMRVHPLLTMCGKFEEHWREILHDEVYLAVEPDSPESHAAIHRATFRYLIKEIILHIAARRREEFITDWMPRDIADVVRKGVRQFTVDPCSVPIERLRLSIRNLFAFQLFDIKWKSSSWAPNVANIEAARVRGILTDPEFRRSHNDLISHMFETNRVVVLHSDYMCYHRLLPVVCRNLPCHTLVAFSARLWAFWLASEAAVSTAEIERAIDTYIMDGCHDTMNEITTRPSIYVSQHGLAAVKQVLDAIYRKNREDGAEICFFRGLEDDKPSHAAIRSETEFFRWSVDYASRLLQKSDEVRAKKILLIETPFGQATNNDLRKPSLNAPDLFHRALREVFAPNQSRLQGPRAPVVEVALHHTHSIRQHSGSPIYEALLGWQFGSFGVQGKRVVACEDRGSQIPAGLAELPVWQLARMKAVYGNYNHVFFSITGEDGPDGGGEIVRDSGPFADIELTVAHAREGKR